ncbi:AAA family ATPase, partial [Streptomyces sp. DR7-3]|uniref:AAA family ATPase n=1 Tax=Streptomyces malaysiensis TaxID=92644 RepID=UPI002043E6AC
MRLHRLVVTAFGPFGATQEIDFDELSAAGLFLLHGPTGAGKTSVLDAVCYALYGQVPGARQGSGLSLRSDHAEPLTPTEVVLEFTVGERRLEITRRPEQPRPKKRGTGMTREKAQTLLREYAPATSSTSPGAGEWKALSRSHQEIGEEIAQLVGMSREQFCQVVLLPQGDFARFLRADELARGKLLGKLFDTGRFAAVEERLAELRRVAEKRVVAGDERLLALAHRMAQAAGRTAELDGHPLPELTPGEPGLADAVLEWAAVARTGARERRDIALSAVRAAEEAHHAAQRAADATHERAELQRRHAEARRRADDLERQRPDHDRLRELLERAHAADAVVPALDLRTAAARDHHTAETTERQARARLSAEPGLAALPLAPTPDIPDQRTPAAPATSPEAPLPAQATAPPEDTAPHADADGSWAGAAPETGPSASGTGPSASEEPGPQGRLMGQTVRDGRTGTGPPGQGAPGRAPDQARGTVSSAGVDGEGVRATGRVTPADNEAAGGRAGSGAGVSAREPGGDGVVSGGLGVSQAGSSGGDGVVLGGLGVSQAGPSGGGAAATRARNAGTSYPAVPQASRGGAAAGVAGDGGRGAGPQGAGVAVVLAEADAEWLGRVERRVREELGALGAARRGEARAAAVVAEIAALDREARADDEAIEEAAEWLAGWEETHRAHQRRGEAAREGGPPGAEGGG